MNRTKIDYGIDLGTTNSSISVFGTNGVDIIKSKPGNEQITPSAIYYTQGGACIIGDKAKRIIERDMINGADENGYLEFKRNMGTKEKYNFTHINESKTPESLSALLLSQLRKYVPNDVVNSAVVTIPAAYTMNQIDAVRRAAEEAGFKYIEVLQEPVAAAIAHGAEQSQENGIWLVFDFGGGTFDSAVIKVEDGILSVLDSSGHNRLGGENLDRALVDNYIVPLISSKFKIDNISSDPLQYKNLKQRLKPFAEQVKNELSFDESCILELFDSDIIDDDGKDIDLFQEVSREDIRPILTPIYQKAIDITMKLLDMHGISSRDLTSLLLVGGPTYSPILREMLAEQITKPDEDLDPMTAVSKGAAIYASTRNVPSNIFDEFRDEHKLQLTLDYESTSVADEELVTIKMLDNSLNDNTNYSCIIYRESDGWESEQFILSKTRPVLCNLRLVSQINNSFKVKIYDESNNLVACEPSDFNIIQGTGFGSMTLTHSWGIGVLDSKNNKIVFSGLSGLEKAKALPATGNIYGLKTQSDIRPAVKDDSFVIPIYQGGHESEGSRVITNVHVYDLVVSGLDIPYFLPKGSDIELKVTHDETESLIVEAYVPTINHTVSLNIVKDKREDISPQWLSNYIEQTRREFNIKGAPSNILSELDEIERSMSSSILSDNELADIKIALSDILNDFDYYQENSGLETAHDNLTSRLNRLEAASANSNSDRINEMVDSLKQDYLQVINSSDETSSEELGKIIDQLYFDLTRTERFTTWLKNADRNFTRFSWSDPKKAHELITEGLDYVGEARYERKLHKVVWSLFDLLPEKSDQTVDRKLLVS